MISAIHVAMRPLDPLSSPHAPEDSEESRQNQGGGDPDRQADQRQHDSLSDNSFTPTHAKVYSGQMSSAQQIEVSPMKKAPAVELFVVGRWDPHHISCVEVGSPSWTLLEPFPGSRIKRLRTSSKVSAIFTPRKSLPTFDLDEISAA